MGECPLVQVKFSGVELSCLGDKGSQVMTIAKPVYEACRPPTVKILRHCRTQAKMAEIWGRIGNLQVPPSLPIKIEAGREVVLLFLLGSQYIL